MSGPCPALQTGGAFLRDTLLFLDCQAQTIGAAGYQALAAPGSVASIALTSILTIFIAIIGLRLILGQTPDIRDGVAAAVKVGVVLVLAVSWPAFRTVVYDVVILGPAQLAGAIGGAATIPGATGGMADRLQNVDDLLLYFVSVGSGQPVIGQMDLSPVEQARVAAQPVSNGVALGIGRTAFLTGVIGPLAIARLGAGFLLAIAPLIAGLLLFEATRGWFFGWIKALVAVALGAAAVALLFGVELAILEPWIGDVVARRSAGEATPAAAGELMALTLGFAIAAFALLALMARFAFSEQLQISFTRATAIGGARSMTNSLATPVPLNTVATLPGTATSRATLISDAVARSDRRDIHLAVAAEPGMTSPAASTSVSGRGGQLSAPVGRQFRRSRPRVSASARRRDR